MSANTQSQEQSIETGTDWNNDLTILNPDEFIEAVDAKLNKWLSPDGSKQEIEVTNPNLTGDPTMLRASLPRKALNFKFISLANDWGLVVKDVWQHDTDKDNDRVCLRLDPVEKADL
jgi:hypothetical protein